MDKRSIRELDASGKRVFVRAVVEVSNYCREQCAYCGMRRDNRNLGRYRARAEQLAQLLANRLERCLIGEAEKIPPFAPRLARPRECRPFLG